MGGKIFCMVYALPGIPLCLVMFQSIGERINTLITRLLRRLITLLHCKNRTVSQTHLIFVSANVVTIVLTAGAAVFAQYEKWHYLDALYYCFITLTTIGFGDFVALQREDSLAKRPDYVAFSLIFILFGLTVVSSVMNLLVLRFLTMNTDDQRRDYLEAAAQAQELRRLHGDVIHSVIGMANHLQPNCRDDSTPDSNAIQFKEMPHVKDVTIMKHPHPKYAYSDAEVTNQFQPLDGQQSAVMIHVEKYFRTFARLFGHENHQNSDSQMENYLPSNEDRVTATASYTESETYDEEYSPWICQASERSDRDQSQHIFRFNDSCYSKSLKRKESKTRMRTENVEEKQEAGTEEGAIVAGQAVGKDKAYKGSSKHSSEDNVNSDKGDCESPPRKCFRYASSDRVSC